MCVCVCVCHRGGYKLTQSSWAPATLHDSLQRTSSSRAASRTDLQRFQSEKSWDVMCSAQENLSEEQLPGHGEGAGMAAQAEEQGGFPQHPSRQGRGKVSTGEMLQLPGAPCAPPLLLVFSPQH